MRIKYFIDYLYDEVSGRFLPIGVWMHNPADGDVDIYYPDEDSREYEEALWIINRLVEAGLKTPEDFLEFHQQRAGYRGVRGSVRVEDTDKDYDEFAGLVLEVSRKEERGGAES